MFEIRPSSVPSVTNPGQCSMKGLGFLLIFSYVDLVLFLSARSMSGFNQGACGSLWDTWPCGDFGNIHVHFEGLHEMNYLGDVSQGPGPIEARERNRECVDQRAWGTL